MSISISGGFTTGSAQNSKDDRGDLASQEDVVVIVIAYPLLTLDLLTLDDNFYKGNHYPSCQTTRADWVQKYIEDFGGNLYVS